MPDNPLKKQKYIDKQKKDKEINEEPFDNSVDKPSLPNEPEINDNEKIEIQDDVNEYLNNLYKIGYNVDVLEDNYLEFEFYYIPLEEFDLNKILDIKKETNLSVKSACPLALQKWNYINYGITKSKRLFIQVVNEGHPIEESKIVESDKSIDMPGFSLKYFINNVVSHKDKTIYNKTVNIKDCVLDNIYLKFPPIIIGGIENKNEESKIVQSTKNEEKIPTEIKKFRLQPGINNGLKDFQIGMFRYYDKELNRKERENEYRIKDLKNSDLSIKNNCYIDLQFEDIDDEKISDLSGNANHGIVVGDMKFNIYDDGKNFEIVEKDLPEIKNDEGPF